MNGKSGVPPAEDLFDKRKADELLPENEGEDLVGKDILDDLVLETGDTMECPIRGLASFGDQDMDVGMKRK